MSDTKIKPAGSLAENLDGSQGKLEAQREGGPELKQQASSETSRSNHGLIDRTVSTTLHRGDTEIERKAGWPFDIYQATQLYPIDYKYWAHAVETSVGQSQCIAMHAFAETESKQTVSADQVFYREAMRNAHFEALERCRADEAQCRRASAGEGWRRFVHALGKASQRE